MSIEITRLSLGVDPSGFEKFEVRNKATNEIIGYDLVAPENLD